MIASDSVHRGLREDRSGEAIAQWIAAAGNTLVESVTVPDEEDVIAGQLESWVEGGNVEVILSTGGTGFSSRDVTPEATWSVIEREAPGIAEAMRAAAQPRVPTAALSRGIAGIARQVLIVNLPGSVAGVTDGLAVLDTFLPHAVKILRDETGH
jgi:molybdenum cofactor synthesis domain-containing protein